MSIRAPADAVAVEHAAERCATLIELRYAARAGHRGRIARVNRRTACQRRVRKGRPAVVREWAEHGICHAGLVARLDEFTYGIAAAN